MDGCRWLLWLCFRSDLCVGLILPLHFNTFACVTHVNMRLRAAVCSEVTGGHVGVPRLVASLLFYSLLLSYYWKLSVFCAQTHLMLSEEWLMTPRWRKFSETFACSRLEWLRECLCGHWPQSSWIRLNCDISDCEIIRDALVRFVCICSQWEEISFSFAHFIHDYMAISALLSLILGNDFISFIMVN